MSKYKVGDRVRIVSSPFCGKTRQAGAVGTVSHVPSRVRGDVEIDFAGDVSNHGWGFHFHEIEHADYKPVEGDRVRVVLEGEVSEVWHSGRFVLQPDNDAVDIGFSADRVEGFNVSIEKIEPGAVLPDGLTISEDGSHLNRLGENYVRQQVEEPVEVFKPGDVVRGKVLGHVFTIAADGYVSHSTGEFRPGYNEFNSKGYEKVALG